jgi:hypothetical protein
MKNEKKEKLFSTGNIILAVIIVLLLASIFFDFFKKDATKATTNTCPVAIENLVITNVVYAEDGVPYDPARTTAPELNEKANYTISAILRNSGDAPIEITTLGLTQKHLGDMNPVSITPIIIQPKDMQKLKIQLDGGDYHKIDVFSKDKCKGNTIWHDAVGHV